MKANAQILLVEDDDVDILSIERAFHELNIRNPLVVKGNGEEALEYLRSMNGECPALIILDLNMPKVNGIEFLKSYKQIDALRWIPSVVLTTSSNHRDVQAAYDNQAAGYIIKPLNFDEFKEVISDIIDYWSRCELPDFD